MTPLSTATKKLRARMPISRIATLLITTSLVGQLLGFLRTKLVNANFPPTGPGSTDAYFAAFNIPDFFFFTLSAGVLGVAFIPVLADKLHKGNRQSVWELTSSLLNLLFLIMAGVALFILIFAGPLIRHVVGTGLGPEQAHNAIVIMRLLALNPLLFTLSGILTSVQQTMGRFFFYAMAPLFYNLSIIASIFIFKHNIGLIGLGIGALFGALLQLLVVAFGLINTRFKWHLKINLRSHDVREVLRQLPPRSLDQGMDQLESIVETRFASTLGSGAVTYYANAFILQTAPILLIGTAVSTAVFPRLASRLSQGRPDLFRADFLRTLRGILWVTMPVVVVCYFARGYLARLIFTQAAPQIAAVFGFLTVAILFRTLYTIISRWFYAQKDTKTPLFVSVFTITLNIILAYVLSRPSNYGVEGLAIAQSVVAAVEVIILTVIMLVRDIKLFDANFWGGVLKIVSVTGFSVVAGSVIVDFLPLGIGDRGFFTLGGKLVLIALVTFAVHISVSTIFGLQEVKPIYNRLKKIILKPLRIPY